MGVRCVAHGPLEDATVRQQNEILFLLDMNEGLPWNEPMPWSDG